MLVLPQQIPISKGSVLFKEGEFAFPEDDFQPLVNLYKLFQELKTQCQKLNGVGLSAVQIGKPFPIFVAKISNSKEIKWRCFINCEYEAVKKSEKFLSVESCLSLTKKDGSYIRYKVSRHNRIKVNGMELIESDGLKIKELKDVVFADIDAVLMQHEIDHHNNVLISEIGQEILCH